MALKPDYQPDSWELRYFMNEVADAGVIVSISTAGSGVAMDSTRNLVTVAGASSGTKPVGVLMEPMVSRDLARSSENWGKSEAVLGDKVSIVTKGWVVTDKVVNATAGSIAVLASSGFVTNSTGTAATNPVIGRFRTNKDENGFAALYVDL